MCHDMMIMPHNQHAGQSPALHEESLHTDKVQVPYGKLFQVDVRTILDRGRQEEEVALVAHPRYLTIEHHQTHLSTWRGNFRAVKPTKACRLCRERTCASLVLLSTVLGNNSSHGENLMKAPLLLLRDDRSAIERSLQASCGVFRHRVIAQAQAR